jgi:hypothetical protein
MAIAGEWRVCDDGVSRPVVLARVVDSGVNAIVEYFLLDTGADRTVLSGGLLTRLRLRSVGPPPDLSLQGIGGAAEFVFVDAVLEFPSRDGATARVRGEFAAFLDPSATDLSILGRDVLNHFDMIVSRRNNEILLIGLNDRYQVVAG